MQLDELSDILLNVFGHSQFRNNQLEIISSILDKKDTFALIPTGGGKSLCYQLPALYLDGMAIVVSPLIALMEDQVHSLQAKNIEAAFLNSTLSKKEQNELEENIFFGHIKILYVSPERFVSRSFQELIKEIEISLLAIDEAHCVSQWGHDFRPEYSKIGEFSSWLDVPKLALTATAGKATSEDIIESLNLNDPKVVVASFDRPNIEIRVKPKIKKQLNFEMLVDFISNEFERDTGIVYCLSRKKTEEIANYLKSNGFPAYAYHAGLNQTKREKILKKFIKDKHVIIVATVAFGMGIDKPNVRFVAHMDLPKCLESYYQEIGRAGRDGKPAVAWMLHGKQELVMIKKMMNKGVSSIRRRRVNEQKLNAIQGFSETFTCRRESLLNYFHDDYQGPCYNCDNCNSELSNKEDATYASKIALQCVYETKQKYDLNYNAHLIVGFSDDQVLKRGHDQIKSFGLGKDQDLKYWHAIYRQLVTLGALEVQMNGSAEVKLTKKALEIINDNEKVWIRPVKISKPTKPKIVQKKPKKKVTRKSVVTKKTSVSSSEQFEYLKSFRKEVARNRRTKPFKVFPDKTLQEMIDKRPTSLDELEDIYGVGPKKIKKYGKLFLKAISDMA